MNSIKKIKNVGCAPGTLPINQQIVSGQIITKASPNEFGLIDLSGESVAYFNYNNIYSNYNSGDTLFFFVTDKSNMLIKIDNKVRQYKVGVHKLAFNLHIPQKSLSLDGGPLKGSNTDLPPGLMPQNYTGDATSFIYVINDCGDILLMGTNSNMKKPWDRCTLKLVCGKCIPKVYGYDGTDSGVWTP